MSASSTAIARTLLDADRVVACGHVNPDGDSIGSLLGIASVLRSVGVDVVTILAEEEAPPERYSFLPGFDDLLPASATGPSDVFLALDTTDPSRLGMAAALAEASATTIVIDHHPDTSDYGDLSLLDPTAAATAQIVWRLLPDLGVVPDATVATCLYTGLMTDSGCFRFANTDEAVLHAAAEMVGRGADPATIASVVYRSQSPAALALARRVLERLKVVNGGRVAYSWITDDDRLEVGALPGDGEDLVDLIRSLGGPQVALLVKVEPDSVRVSLRAEGDTDVGSVARALGGGGHRAASGVTLAGDLDSALVALLPVLPGGARG